MTTPITRHRNLDYLVKEFSATSAGRRLLGAPAQGLVYGLWAPAAIAWWITQRHPELVSRPALRIAVLQAEHFDAFDDGRWYSQLAWMLGNERMTVDVTLVGPTLLRRSQMGQGTPSDPRTKAGTSSLLGAVVEALWPPAKLAGVPVKRFLDGAGEGFDLFVLFAPGFEEMGTEDATTDWHAEGVLDVLADQRSAPVAVFSQGRVEAVTEGWLLSRHGFHRSGDITGNPFMLPFEPGHADGVFGSRAWELARARTDAPGLTEEEDEWYGRFQMQVAGFVQAADYMVSDELGLVHQRAVGKEKVATPLVALAIRGNWVDPATGVVYEEQQGQLVALDGTVSSEHLRTYPAGEPQDSLPVMAWALAAFLEHAETCSADFDEEDDVDTPKREVSMGDMLRTVGEMTKMRHQLEGTEDEGLVFSPDAMDGMADLYYRATGQKMPADFPDQMRLAGAESEPVAIDWYNLLSNLDWKLTDDVDEPERFEPAFYAETTDGRVRVPVVCEGYTYLPGDMDDNLAEEAKGRLANRYPDGVLICFKAMVCVEKDGRVYSFGGLFYRAQQWRPVALCVAMKGLEALLQQLEERFSFNAPTSKYEDRNGRLAIALNRMTHGEDPNDHNQKVLRMSTGGDWFTLIPDQIVGRG